MKNFFIIKALIITTSCCFGMEKKNNKPESYIEDEIKKVQADYDYITSRNEIQQEIQAIMANFKIIIQNNNGPQEINLWNQLKTILETILDEKSKNPQPNISQLNNENFNLYMKFHDQLNNFIKQGNIKEFLIQFYNFEKKFPLSKYNKLKINSTLQFLLKAELATNKINLWDIIEIKLAKITSLYPEYFIIDQYKLNEFIKKKETNNFFYLLNFSRYINIYTLNDRSEDKFEEIEPIFNLLIQEEFKNIRGNESDKHKSKYCFRQMLLIKLELHKSQFNQEQQAFYLEILSLKDNTLQFIKKAYLFYIKFYKNQSVDDVINDLNSQQEMYHLIPRLRYEFSIITKNEQENLPLFNRMRDFVKSIKNRLVSEKNSEIFQAFCNNIDICLEEKDIVGWIKEVNELIELYHLNSQNQIKNQFIDIRLSCAVLQKKILDEINSTNIPI